jgi:hypothetical protein
MDYPNCQLKHEEGRNFKFQVLQDEDSSYNLTLFGKNSRGRLLKKDDWNRLKGENDVIVGIDIEENDIQLAFMVGRPEKATVNEDFQINGSYITTVYTGQFYFPVKLLVKVPLNKSNYNPNCYMSLDGVHKVPLHCIIPPYFEQGDSISSNQGKESVNFTNYIETQKNEVSSSRGIMNTIIIDHAEIRKLENNI